MDEMDGWLLGLGLAGLAAAVILLSLAVKSLQTDIELLRITAAVPAERNT